MTVAGTTALTEFWAKCKAAFQDKLVSGTNIKTINGDSILGSGDLAVTATVPTASTTTLGGVKVGSGLSIDANGVLSLDVPSASGVSF